MAINRSSSSAIWENEKNSFENILLAPIDETQSKNISIFKPEKDKDLFVFKCGDAQITYKKGTKPFIEYCSLIDPKKPQALVKLTPNSLLLTSSSSKSSDKTTIREILENTDFFKSPKGVVLLNNFDKILSLDPNSGIKPLNTEDFSLKILESKIKEQEAIISTLEKNLKKAKKFVENSFIGKLYLRKEIKTLKNIEKQNNSTLTEENSLATKELFTKESQLEKLKLQSETYKIRIDELTQKSQKALKFIEDIKNNHFGRLLFKKELQDLDSEKDDFEK